MLAVIPARGGSKGLPGKNIRTFAGLPLIAHSIMLGKLCPEIDRLIVSTDSPEIAQVARQFGADVPFMRPRELAQDETPLWPVLRHALETAERQDGREYGMLLVLDPTSPTRVPEDIAGAAQRLREASSADGVIGVSQPEFNPIWHCVVERGGWMADLIEEGGRFERRQDAPAVYRINGLLYLWRTDFVRKQQQGWRRHGKHLMYEIPERRAVSIDNLQEFERAEMFVRHGLIALPWLKNSEVR